MNARLQALRVSAGLTQAELALRAGVSRQLIGAAEAGRNLPRVDAAMAIAAALGVEVASVFSPEIVPVDIVTGAVPAEGSLVRSGRVGDHLVTTAVGIGGEGWEAADGVVEAGALTPFGRRGPGLVVAGCEPGLEMLERILRDRGMGAVAAPSSSAGAVAALEAGRIHAAVVHGPVGTLAARRSSVAVDRFRITRWRVGLAGPAAGDATWWRDALAGRVYVVQREPGAAVQRPVEDAAEAPP